MKILIVDDHALFRGGLRMLLSTIGSHVTTIEASSGAQALEVLGHDSKVDICLLDLALQQENGISLIQAIKQAAPSISVVVVSGLDDAQTIKSCIDAGAMSFVPKRVPPEVLTQALQHVLRGTIYLPQTIYDISSEMVGRPNLTPRQTDVLRCLSRGLPTKLISRELGLSEYTVKDHISLIFQTLGVNNRTAAVIKASRLNLLPLLATDTLSA